MTGMRARNAPRTALVLVLAVLLGGGGYLITRVVRQPGPPTSTSRPAVPPVAKAATGVPSRPAVGATAPMPSVAGVARALAPALTASALGPSVRARVVDVATGATLFDRGGTVPAAPASTAKLMTAAAILTVHRPTDRLATTVLVGRGNAVGTVYLRGGGDPTLTSAAPGRPGAYPQAARLSDLADAVRSAHVTVRRIVVDGSVFTGPAVSPAWAADDVPSEYGAAITGLMSDGGRAAPRDVIRSVNPDLDTGRALAVLLRSPDVTVTRGVAPASGQVLATVRSAPVSVLVEQMLLDSDNVIAECLARQVAVARHEPASFAGAVLAVRTVLAQELGVDPGAGMRDGSGLAAGDRVSPAVLAALLRVVATGRRPAERSVVSALPVAGWSGTLAGRYTGTSRTAAGDVRAKTGTLTGVSTLAGLVHDRDGRLLAFSLVADRTGPTPAAETGLDNVAATVAACGCR